MQRRKFIKNSTALGAGLAVAPLAASYQENQTLADGATIKGKAAIKPLAICTWNFHNATAKAWEVLQSGGNALDAVEQGVMVEENNLDNGTVGRGGRPDREGRVTLDACIMDKDRNCGAVLAIEHIGNPVAVARKVMEETPHVMLVGKGAELFAYEMGFKKEDLLTEKSKKEWEKWKETSQYKPIINIENHDTIGMLTIDANGDLAGACTTSGLAYKMAGRVGDSPIIGAGLYVDNEVGGATATGMGEEVVRNVGSFLVVELMRQGRSPEEACKEAVMRIVSRYPEDKLDFQVGFIAINKQGETGGYCIHPGFSYSLYTAEGQTNVPGDSFIKKKKQ